MHLSGDKGKIVVYILFILTWLYLWLRAVYLPLVHDEAATFFIYVQSGNYLPFHCYADANNHFLNSVLANLSFRLFGGDSLALRLPNVLLWPVYYFSVYAIIKRVQNISARWILFLGLILAHNFFEFFGLCRGYGLSMGLLMLAFLFLIRSVEKKQLIDAIFCLIAMMLALSANLTLINTAILMVLLLLANFLFDHNTIKQRIINISILIIIGAPPLYYFLKWLLFLKQSGSLYYHSAEGFFNATPATVGTMITGIDSVLPGLLIIALSLCVLVLLTFHLVKGQLVSNLTGIIFAFLLLGNYAVILLGHLFLGINYPEDRTAMFLFPLLLISLVFLLDAKEYRFIRITRYPVIILMLFLPLHFLYSLNITHSSLWYQEGIPQRFYDNILKEKKNTGSIPTIGGYMLRRFCWGYLNYSNGGELPPVKTTDYPDMTADYQIVHMNKDIPWLYTYHQVDYDLPSGLSLLERKTRLNRKEVYRSSLPGGQSDAEYFSLFEHDIDSIQAGSLFVDISFELESDAAPLPAAVIGTVNDSNGKSVAYESIELNWYHFRWTGTESSFHQGILISHLPADAKHMIVYIVNSLKKQISVKNSTVVIYQLF